MSKDRDVSNLPLDGGMSDAQEMPAERVSMSKRTLLKAGWVAPAIVVLNLPKNSFATNSSGVTRPPITLPRQPLPALPPAPPWWWPRGWPWPPW